MEPKLSSMELILAICTILGGLSAVWFFWDKIAIYWGSFLNLFRKNEEIPLLSLPDDEHYETLGGMIVNFTQGIPQAGETVVIGNYQIEIIEVSNTKIDLVCVKMCNPDT